MRDVRPGLRPYEPNTHPPFWFLCRQLRCTCGTLTQRAIGFVPVLHEAALQAASADLYLGEGDMREAAFQRGFADWIGETHPNQGLKTRSLFRCSDSNRWLLRFVSVRHGNDCQIC
ncbi:hypothetical protein PBY51_019722 [Eleginops maclovinus]|uniref:Uncharacterized protein n=1 Tax=Eleginops maclovinus TaxID=56733 RepID=A0AAN8AR22_ELEMC|nr:hypothetical protein PBY51_019722 [Eleginops maclovinus]